MLSVIRVMIASEDSTFSKLFSATTQPSEGLSVVGMYTSGIGLMDAIRHDKPDVLLIDFMLPGVNTLTILHEINRLTSEERPTVYVLSSFASPETVAECHRLGVCFFLRKPIDIASLIDLISRYGISSRHSLYQPKAQPSWLDVFMYVTQILTSLQIPAHVAGYGYVRECIMLTLADTSTADSVTKILYPTVAKNNNTTWTSVERDIRNAIEIAWKRSNGYMPGFSTVRRPPNREFILTIVDRVRCEMHLDQNYPDQIQRGIF